MYVGRPGDAGAFYMGRDWTNQGNILRHNIFHDIYGFGLSNEGSANNDEFNVQYEAPLWAWGIYLNDCTSGIICLWKYYLSCAICGVMIGGGRDNLVEITFSWTAYLRSILTLAGIHIAGM